jgi:hyaluronoglucosaminidase
MQNKKNKNIFGYIEGFYGALLSWNDRKRIIRQLSQNNMNTYFYAPKEDLKHRLNWKIKYGKEWRQSFRDFTKYSKVNKIKIIAGIAPGLDFNYNCIKYFSSSDLNSDFHLLLNKAKQLLQDGATDIALLLDDIPDNFKKKFGLNNSEGHLHGVLSNKISEYLNQSIFLVPRIYADELIKDSPDYLIDLSKILNIDTKIFYCGENVICKNITNSSILKTIIPNRVIYWDNFYANDYCPRRFFIGPYVGRKGLNDIMINPTGLINTDLLILDIVAITKDENNPMKLWLEILHNHKIPSIFTKIKKYFLRPDFGSKPNSYSFKISSKQFEALEILLWSWKSDLSREWYPYLFGLKHDLQLNQEKLTTERLIKTQTKPLAEYINKIL